MNRETVDHMFHQTAGVISCAFRLLPSVRDHNYFGVELQTGGSDPGYQHVFEVTRADRCMYRLHFHGNGKVDRPRKVEPTDVSYTLQPEERVAMHLATMPS